MTSLVSTRRTSDLSTPESITELVMRDVRFPTSRQLDGSDAMNPQPDYSAAYVVLRTSAGDEGHSLVFTIGRGTEVQVEAVRAFAPLVVGLAVEEGVAHMAHGAIVNALWDLRARRAVQPLWLHLAELSPEELVALVDFRYLRDALTEDEALRILRRAEPGRAERVSRLRTAGYPAYTTTPGWLGYDDEKLVRLCLAAIDEGFTQIKLKVGGDLQDDRRRLALAREAVGPKVRIAIDANQVWGVEEAIAWVDALHDFDPYWIEEPTAPDDVLGHAAIRRAVAPVKVATGEHGHSQVLFKQLLQADGER
jgi:L-fuconate dehydratase